MTRFRFALSLVLVFIMVPLLAVLRNPATATETGQAAPARSFEFTYQVHVPANADPAGPTHLWIPLPQADDYQDVCGLHIDSLMSHVQGHDPEYGNAFAAFTPTMQQSAAGFDVRLQFTAVRREHKGALGAAGVGRAACRGRGEISGGAGSIKKKTKQMICNV